MRSMRSELRAILLYISYLFFILYVSTFLFVSFTVFTLPCDDMIFNYAGGEEQATNNWKGLFRISSYASYFNVDTDVVVDRIISSVYPMNDFSRKIDGNPDM